MARIGARLGANRIAADDRYRLALESFHKNNLEEAILNINAAIELYPNSSEYHAARGLFRLEDGLPDEAEPDFDRALQLHPYEVLANYGKGALTYARGEYAGALMYFTNAWAADERRPETLYYLAMTNHRLRNNARAKAWMQQAAAIFAAIDTPEGRRRKRQAERWLTEFEKLLAQPAS